MGSTHATIFVAFIFGLFTILAIMFSIKNLYFNLNLGDLCNLLLNFQISVPILFLLLIPYTLLFISGLYVLIRFSYYYTLANYVLFHMNSLVPFNYDAYVREHFPYTIESRIGSVYYMLKVSREMRSTLKLAFLIYLVLGVSGPLIMLLYKRLINELYFVVILFLIIIFFIFLLILCKYCYHKFSLFPSIVGHLDKRVEISQDDRIQVVLSNKGKTSFNIRQIILDNFESDKLTYYEFDEEIKENEGLRFPLDVFNISNYHITIVTYSEYKWPWNKFFHMKRNWNYFYITINRTLFKTEVKPPQIKVTAYNTNCISDKIEEILVEDLKGKTIDVEVHPKNPSKQDPITVKGRCKETFTLVFPSPIPKPQVYIKLKTQVGEPSIMVDIE